MNVKKINFKQVLNYEKLLLKFGIGYSMKYALCKLCRPNNLVNKKRATINSRSF
jgi:hypothetical protein